MSLIYKPKITINKKFLSMEFNERGTRLAAITEGRFISIWDVTSGKKYFPVLGSEVGLSASIVWMDDNAFLCGIQRGYLLACYLDNNEEGSMLLVHVAEIDCSYRRAN